MILLIGLAILTVIGFVLANYDDWKAVCAWLSLILLLSYLLIAMGISIEITKFIRKDYPTTIQTIEMMRENGNDYENATIINKIIETNQEVNEYKYWNKTMFGWIIPDEVEELKLIR